MVRIISFGNLTAFDAEALCDLLEHKAARYFDVEKIGPNTEIHLNGKGPERGFLLGLLNKFRSDLIVRIYVIQEPACAYAMTVHYHTKESTISFVCCASTTLEGMALPDNRGGWMPYFDGICSNHDEQGKKIFLFLRGVLVKALAAQSAFEWPSSNQQVKTLRGTPFEERNPLAFGKLAPPLVK